MMQARTIREGWRMSSVAVKLGLIAAGLIVLIMLAVGGYSFVQNRAYEKRAARLEQENREISAKYDQAIGQAKAFEQTAREEKLKSDALIATIEAGTKNVKILDEKLATVEGNYEKSKAELGDCGATPDECTRKLCLELRAAGFKVPSCD